MPFFQTKWIGGVVLGISLLLGLWGSGLLFANAVRPLDCPDPGIFINPDTTATAHIREIEPPPGVDPEMIRSLGADCQVADPGALFETDWSTLGITRRPGPYR